MRSTEDLISELEQESKAHFTCSIAIGFADTSIFIRSTDANRLRLLNEAITNGGIPLGLILVDKLPGTVTVTHRIYPEYASEEQATEYMDGLMAGIEKQFKGGLSA